MLVMAKTDMVNDAPRRFWP